MFYPKYQLLVLILWFFVSCTAREKKTENATPESHYPGHMIGKIDLLTAEYDTLTVNVTNPNKGNQDLVHAVPYRPTTKLVDWYYIGHAANGTAVLTVITAGDRKIYEIELDSPASVAAASSLLQSSYVRIDSVSKELFSYKSALKGF